MFKQNAAAIVAGLAILVAAPAFADIAAFNAAVRAGDYKAAAAETATIWSTFDKTSPDAAAVAREFGFANLVAGNYSAARDFGRFLKDEGAGLAQSDDLKATSAVLLAMAEFRLKPQGAQRDALAEALQDRARQPGVDNITILAADALYHGDWSRMDWKKTEDSTAVAADLFGRGQGQLKAKKDEALLIGATAQFMDQPIDKDYYGLVDVHNAIIDDIDAATGNPALRQTLIGLKFQAEAWVEASWAYFYSSRTTVGSLTASRVPEQRELKEPQQGLFVIDGPADPRPICKHTVEASKLHYPQSKSWRGAAGAVVIRLDFDEKGAEKSVEVLAAVPAREFADTVVRAARTFRLQPSSGQDMSKCRLNAQGVVYRTVFIVG
jgi:TonB family protein